MACSGMLPGYVSGFYTHEDCHVDLNRLAHYANARLILQPATGLDMQVALSGHRREHPWQQMFTYGVGMYYSSLLHHLRRPQGVL